MGMDGTDLRFGVVVVWRGMTSIERMALRFQTGDAVRCDAIDRM